MHILNSVLAISFLKYLETNNRSFLKNLFFNHTTIIIKMKLSVNSILCVHFIIYIPFINGFKHHNYRQIKSLELTNVEKFYSLGTKAIKYYVVTRFGGIIVFVLLQFNSFV